MKNKSYEFVQKIESHYVGEDCIQVMNPHSLNDSITVLNKYGITYHYKPNSQLFINHYISDERKKIFPYSNIPTHKDRIGLKKYEYVNQLLDFNKVYIEISNNIVKEYFAIKDGEEALLATKYIIPYQEESKFVNRKEMLEYLKSTNGGMFTTDGSHRQNYSILTEKELIDWYKELLINARKRELDYNDSTGIEKKLTEYFYESIENLTIDYVPTNLIIFDDTILINKEDDEIKSVKQIVIKFLSADKYEIEIYNYPITIYSLEHMKKLEQTSRRKASEPKFPKCLNKTIDKNEIKKAKQLVLKRKNN